LPLLKEDFKTDAELASEMTKILIHHEELEKKENENEQIKSKASVRIRLNVKPREQVENEFYDHLISEYGK
jgi:hypothetical protein